jgi:hypothetical protein
VPTNPRTSRQTQVRDNFGASASAWQSLPTAAIAGWNLYAATVDFTSKLGMAFQASGFNWFCRVNSYTLLFGAAANVGAPSGGQVQSPPSFYAAPTIIAGALAVIIAPPQDDWPNSDSILGIFVSKPVPPGSTSNNSPKRLAGSINCGAPGSGNVIYTSADPFSGRASGTQVAIELVLLGVFGSGSGYNLPSGKVSTIIYSS